MVKSSKDDLDGPKIDRRTTMKLLSAAGLTGVGTALAGCAGNANEPDGSGQADKTNKPSSKPKPGGTIDAGWLTNEIVHLDPHLVDKGVQMQIISNVFNGLLKYNDNVELVGDVAKDWTVENGTTYTFQLHEGITFQNGDPLDANAVKWSLNRLRDLKKSPHIGKVKPIKQIEAPDSTTVIITLEEPIAPFITFMSLVPGRAGAIVNKTAVKKNPDRYDRYPVGSGPFKVTDRQVGESLTLTKFKNYWQTGRGGQQLPYLDEVKIRLIPEPTTMWSALNTEAIQFSSHLPPQFADRAEKAQHLDVVGSSPGNWKSIALLCSNPSKHENWAKMASEMDTVTDKWEGQEIPTSNKKVRQAMAKAVNREELINKAFFGWAEPAHSLFNPAISWLSEKESELGQYHDPEGAKQLLDEAGYTGNPRFTATLLGVPEDKRAMTILQQQMRNVGIEVELNIQPPSSYWTSIYKYTHMASVYGGATDVDPYMSWWRQLHTPAKTAAKGEWQKNLYSNPEFDSLIEKSFRTPDREKRLEYIKQAEQIFIEDSPYLMTAFPLIPKASVAKLQGVTIPLGLSNFHRAYLN